jgi:hypothetical protein
MIVPSGEKVQMLGSSTIIFGLMGICLVWAPRNEVSCIVWIRFIPMEFDLSILWFAVLYIAMDIFSGGLSGVVRASVTNQSAGLIVAVELDHTIGAILGMIVGAVMLRLNWVDCEHWDVFAVLERRAGRPRGKETKTRKSSRRVSSEFGERKKARKKKDTAPPKSIEDPVAGLLRTFRGHIELEETEAAMGLYRKARGSPSGWMPPERERRDLIENLIEQEFWDDAVLVMRDYLREVPDPSPRVRLKLAQVLIQKQGRPQQALKVLGQIPEGSLPENLETLRARLVRNAEAVLEAGPLEIDEDLGS